MPTPTSPAIVVRMRELMASPAEVHRYFAGLTTAEQTELAMRYPAVVGRLDGAPPALRYEANRRQMRYGPYNGWDGQHLLFDPLGRGRVALVHGDLSCADRIAVLVPGAGQSAATFARGTGGHAYRAPAVQAGNLHRAIRDTHPAARVAVIAWLGYRTPPGLGIAAARRDLAAHGAVALARFVDGLTAVRPQSTIALLGHSYGSSVVGLAAPHLSDRVRNIVAFGSPGLGVAQAAQLRTRATVWAAQSARDWIRLIPGVRLGGWGHGRRPVTARFGARPIPTTGVTSHDHYLSPGTGFLAALVDIVVGTPAVTTR